MKKSIVAVVHCLAVAWAMGQDGGGNPGTGKAQTQTKVSEVRKSGKYKRISETFTDGVLVTRKEEVSVKDNGRMDYVFVKHFRNGEMTYSQTLYNSENRTIRSYYHQEKMIVLEGDENGDGFFETMILFDAQERPVEAFSKQKDGSVVPFAKEKLAELKKRSFAMVQE
ncbi:MAG: hypothetical protein ACKPGI_07035 [Verrucomicrobiota bacterium]